MGNNGMGPTSSFVGSMVYRCERKVRKEKPMAKRIAARRTMTPLTRTAHRQKSTWKQCDQ